MSSKEQKVRTLRFLQFAAPIPLIVAAAMLYAFWDDPLKSYICGALLFMAVADVLIFKYLGDLAERE